MSTKQGFWEITQEALNTYAPLTAASIFPEAWESAKVDGKVYMLPQNYKEMPGYIYRVRGDLMKKYGIEKIGGIDDMEKCPERSRERVRFGLARRIRNGTFRSLAQRAACPPR